MDRHRPLPEERAGRPIGRTGQLPADHPPNDPVAHAEDFWSRHREGVNFLFADGSVQNINNSINPALWKALATRNGGEPASLE